MDRVPVIVMRNKTNSDRYLAACMEAGDWDDENLEVTMDNIQNAYMIARKDLAAPTIVDFEEHKSYHAEVKRVLIEKFGPDPFISLDFVAACEAYEPINIEITKEQYDYAKEWME